MDRPTINWRYFDFFLLGAVAILAIFGIAMIRSAIAGNIESVGTQPGGSPDYLLGWGSNRHLHHNCYRLSFVVCGQQADVFRHVSFARRALHRGRSPVWFSPLVRYWCDPHPTLRTGKDRRYPGAG